MNQSYYRYRIRIRLWDLRRNFEEKFWAKIVCVGIDNGVGTKLRANSSGGAGLLDCGLPWQTEEMNKHHHSHKPFTSE